MLSCRRSEREGRCRVPEGWRKNIAGYEAMSNDAIVNDWVGCSGELWIVPSLDTIDIFPLSRERHFHREFPRPTAHSTGRQVELIHRAGYSVQNYQLSAPASRSCAYLSPIDTETQRTWVSIVAEPPQKRDILPQPPTHPVHYQRSRQLFHCIAQPDPFHPLNPDRKSLHTPRIPISYTTV